jgi:chaperonin GroEL
MGKLTGGIAKLKIFGSSNGELREKRDRAEDAICAVRGAIKHGTLPGGGHTLVDLTRMFRDHHDPIYREVLAKALMEPVERLFKNAGFSEEERGQITCQYNGLLTYDLLEGKMIDPYVAGLLDSTPAVLEAIRNAISIATLLGTCGGTIAFKRDGEVDKAEAKEVRNFLRDSGEEPITERP